MFARLKESIAKIFSLTPAEVITAIGAVDSCRAWEREFGYRWVSGEEAFKYDWASHFGDIRPIETSIKRMMHYGLLDRKEDENGVVWYRLRIDWRERMQEVKDELRGKYGECVEKIDL